MGGKAKLQRECGLRPGTESSDGPVGAPYSSPGELFGHGEMQDGGAGDRLARQRGLRQGLSARVISVGWNRAARRRERVLHNPARIERAILAQGRAGIARQFRYFL